jgi:hypothetical protein
VNALLSASQIGLRRSRGRTVMRLEDNVHRPARGPTRQSFGVKADRPIPPHFFADVNQEDYKMTIQHNPATDLSMNKRSSPPSGLYAKRDRSGQARSITGLRSVEAGRTHRVN